MITKIDANGRIQLPLTIRYCLDLNAGDELAVDHLGDGTIIIKKIEAETHLAETDLAEARAHEPVNGGRILLAQ